MGIIKLTANEPPTDPLRTLAWDIYKGYADQPDNLTDDERKVIVDHIERFKERDAERIRKHLATDPEWTAGQIEVDKLAHEQDVVTFALRLLFKFTADESVRKDIEEKTQTLAEEWQRWQEGWKEYDRYDIGTGEKIGTETAPSSFTDVADRIQHNLSVYEQMLNGYAERTPVNNAALASQEKCAALTTRIDTMKAQAALAIDAAREQGRREKQSEMARAMARKRKDMKFAP